MARRWRWPPETLVPPCAIARLEPAGHAPRRSRRPGRSRAPPTSPRRWRRACRSAGCSRPCPENRYGRCGTRPMRPPEQLGVEVAHVDAVDQHAPAGGVEQAGDQVTSVVLPAPVLPMIAVGLARRGGKEMSVSTGCVGARVAGSRTSRNSSCAAPGDSGTGRAGGTTEDVGVEHLLMRSAQTAARGIMISHERGHHHRHQDLHQVAEERRQRADLHLARCRSGWRRTSSTATLETLRMSMTIGNISAISRPARSAVSVRSALARRSARRLVRLADEGPHHPDAGDLLAQHPVDLVDALLHEPELRHHLADDQRRRRAASTGTLTSDQPGQRRRPRAAP